MQIVELEECMRDGTRFVTGERRNSTSPDAAVSLPWSVDDGGCRLAMCSRAELVGPRGDGYRRMIEMSPAGRARTPDEVATVAAFLLGPDSTFITGTDVRMDGGATAAYFYGDVDLR